MLIRHEPKSYCSPNASQSPHWITKLASSSAFEAYFVRLGAMLAKHGSGNGITTSPLFRRGCRGRKSDGGSGAKPAHVTTLVEPPDSGRSEDTRLNSSHLVI